jgi:hypothetical protein
MSLVVFAPERSYELDRDKHHDETNVDSIPVLCWAGRDARPCSGTSRRELYGAGDHTGRVLKLRVPQLFNLRAVFLLVPAQEFVAKWISSFKEFPPRQKPASFSIDEVMRKLEEAPRK